MTARPRQPVPKVDATLARNIERWFRAAARDLPWRTSPRDPWASLVSEIMLQQTQAARVAERFADFLARFPTPRAMADSGEDDVLAAWSGLGYYRRARNLHAAACEIVERHAGRVPSSVDDLRGLTGVGAYTAGAVASTVFGLRVPLVDANVSRVLMRISAKRATHGSSEAMRWSWSRADELVRAATSPASFNEGLMELGAVVCTPRNPRCDECPARASCESRRLGLQAAIPVPKQAPKRKTVYHAAVVSRDSRGRVLLERRPDNGLWAGMWQAPTLERASRPRKASIEQWIGTPGAKRTGAFTHQTTHRTVHFIVYTTNGSKPPRAFTSTNKRRWVARSRLDAYAMSTPQRRILLETS